MRCEVCQNLPHNEIEYSFCSEDCLFHFLIEELNKNNLKVIFVLQYTSETFHTEQIVSVECVHYFKTSEKRAIFRNIREKQTFYLCGMMRKFTNFRESTLKIELSTNER